MSDRTVPRCPDCDVGGSLTHRRGSGAADVPMHGDPEDEWWCQRCRSSFSEVAWRETPHDRTAPTGLAARLEAMDPDEVPPEES